jgi:hypothetical protein
MLVDRGNILYDDVRNALLLFSGFCYAHIHTGNIRYSARDSIETATALRAAFCRRSIMP